MHARFYHPQIGRFLSFDPVGGVQGMAQSLNRYPYVLGNPLKYTDPRGLSSSNPFDDDPVASFGDSITVTGQSWSIFFSVMGLLAGPGSSGSGGFHGAPSGGVTSPFVDLTWDPVTDSRIQQLHPCMQGRARALVNLAEDQLKVNLRISSGFRSLAEQARIYAQGRFGNPGPTVSDAPPGRSYHNYGLALDVAPLVGGKLDWNINWLSVGTLGEQLGFEWGGRWQHRIDRTHFQLTLDHTTSQLQTMTPQLLQSLGCP